jgi:zinc transport system ATP-binding protein
MRQASVGYPDPTSSAATGRALLAGSDVTLRRRDQVILDRVDVAVSAGEIVTLIGPNGAGKSTLVRILLGLLRPDSGEVARRPGLRIGYVPQHLAVDPVLPITVGRYLALGGRASRGVLADLLTRVGFGRGLDHGMDALSGGELRRVALARSLLRRPDLLVLDEPMGGVDVTGQVELYELIGRARDEEGTGVLLVSHDLHLVMARTDRVVCLDGHVCCVGRPVQVAAEPAFQRLFGDRLGDVMALYRHRQDHHHHVHGQRHHHAALEVEAEGER